MLIDKACFKLYVIILEYKCNFVKQSPINQITVLFLRVVFIGKQTRSITYTNVHSASLKGFFVHIN